MLIHPRGFIGFRASKGMETELCDRAGSATVYLFIYQNPCVYSNQNRSYKRGSLARGNLDADLGKLTTILRTVVW